MHALGFMVKMTVSAQRFNRDQIQDQLMRMYES